MDEKWLWVLIPFLFFVAFGGLWVLVTGMISYSGWSRLAGQYRAHTEPSAQAKRFYAQSLGVGNPFFGPSYKSCINGWLDDRGIFLQPNAMFKLFHPMLFLDWSLIQSVNVKTRLGFQQTELQMAGDVPRMRFVGNLGTEILNHWQRTGPPKAI